MMDLEQQMDDLKDLPGAVERVASQILQFQAENRLEFSAIREEMRTEFTNVRREMQESREELREDIRIGVEESQNLTRLLHIEAMDAIATLDATLRRDVIERLDALLRLQRRGQEPPA